ncbi:30S ribosomal protein S20 [bacterium]|nr:30S ribosomal protein S20 [bacterium]
MPHVTSAKKRLRQNKKRRMQNRAVKSDLRTHVKKLLKSIKEKNAASATEILKTVASKLDKAGSRRYLHPNTAARYKGRLTKRVLAIASAS